MIDKKILKDIETNIFINEMRDIIDSIGVSHNQVIQYKEKVVQYRASPMSYSFSFVFKNHEDMYFNNVRFRDIKEIHITFDYDCAERNSIAIVLKNKDICNISINEFTYTTDTTQVTNLYRTYQVLKDNEQLPRGFTTFEYITYHNGFPCICDSNGILWFEYHNILKPLIGFSYCGTSTPDSYLEYIKDYIQDNKFESYEIPELEYDMNMIIQYSENKENISTAQNLLIFKLGGVKDGNC
jgi:hypothetical protein